MQAWVLHENCWDAHACIRAVEMMHPAPLAMRYQRSCRRWSQAHGCSSYCVAAGFLHCQGRPIPRAACAGRPQTILSTRPLPPQSSTFTSARSPSCCSRAASERAGGIGDIRTLLCAINPKDREPGPLFPTPQAPPLRAPRALLSRALPYTLCAPFSGELHCNGAPAPV